MGIASSGEEFPRFFENAVYLNRAKEMMKTLKTSSFIRMQTNWYSMAMPNLFAPSEYLKEEIRTILDKVREKRAIGVIFEMKAMEKQMTQEAALAKLRSRFELMHELTKSADAALFFATDCEEAEKEMEKEFGAKLMTIKSEPLMSGEEVSERKLKRFFMELTVLGKTSRLVMTRNGELGTLALYFHTISPRIYYF